MVSGKMGLPASTSTSSYSGGDGPLRRTFLMNPSVVPRKAITCLPVEAVATADKEMLGNVSTALAEMGVTPLIFNPTSPQKFGMLPAEPLAGHLPSRTGPEIYPMFLKTVHIRDTNSTITKAKDLPIFNTAIEAHMNVLDKFVLNIPK